MRDFNLEMLACVDIDRALSYIGKNARHRNIYQDAKPRKAKNDPSDGELPLFAINQINPKGIKNHGTQSQNC